MSTNVASQANGGVATADSSPFGAGFPIAAVNDGTRNCATPNAYTAGSTWATNTNPSWAQVEFNAAYDIGEVDVITLRDDYMNTAAPTLSDTANSFGIVDFKIQFWNGSTWVDIATVTANNKLWRQFTFTPVNTTKVRVLVTATADSATRIVELEAWTADAVFKAAWARNSNVTIGTPQ